LSPGGTPKSSDGRQAALYLVGAAVQGLAPILVQPVAIRTLDAVQWGRVGVSTVILQIGLVVLAAGLPLAITKAWFLPTDGPVKARAIAGAGSLASPLLAAAAAGTWAISLAAAGSLAENLAFVIAVIAMGMLSVVVFGQALVRAERKAHLFVLLSAGSSVGAHGLGLAAILLITPTATAYLTAFAMGVTLTAAAALLWSRPISPRRHVAEVRHALRVGMPILPHSLAMILLMQGDSLLLKVLQGDALAGEYIAAAAFALGPFAVLSGLNNVWTPRIMAAAHGPDFAREVGSVARQALAVAVVLSVGGTAGAVVGMWVLAGDDPVLMQVARVLPVVSAGYALYLVSMAVLFARGRTGHFSYATIALVLACLPLAVAATQGGNLVALAAVKVLAFSGLGLLYALLVRSSGASPLKTMPFVILMVILGTLGALALLLPTTLPAGIATLSVVFVSGGGIVAAFRLRRDKPKRV
jgi:O-antigen/teichoic acid export membrane protein